MTQVRIPESGLIQDIVDSASCRAVWETVIATPGVGLALVRCDGVFLYASDEFKRLFLGDTDFALEGQTLIDVFPQEWAREHMEFLARAEQSEMGTTVREIWRGRQLLSRVNVLPWKHQSRSVACVVARPANSGETRALEGSFERSAFIELGGLSVLTPRELAVLALLGEGLTLKQIAERLQRSFKTIDNHRAAIGRKLHESDRVGLSKLALEAGLTLADTELKRVSWTSN